MSTETTVVRRNKGDRITDEMVNDWVDRRLRGETLQEIAELYNTTPQYVLSLTKTSASSADFAQASGTAVPMSDEDIQAKADEINEWLPKRGTVTVPELVEHFKLTKHQWSLIRRHVDQAYIFGRAHVVPRRKVYSDEDIHKALKRVLAISGRQTLTAVVYESLRDRETEPSVPTVHNRYRTWRAACEAAGVPSGAREKSTTWSGWTDEDLLSWVRKFHDELSSDVRPSYGRYDAWQRDIEGAPSGSLLRVRLGHLGNWADIMNAAIQSAA